MDKVSDITTRWMGNAYIFIISANNRIPMIQRAINNLSEKYGKFIGEYRGKKYYAFPTPEELKAASVEDIRRQTGLE